MTGKTLQPAHWCEIPKHELERLDETEEDVLWRAETLGYGIRFVRYNIIRHTPQGHWLSSDDCFRLHHSKTWRAKNTYFASATRREALLRLRARKGSYVMHSKRRLKDAQQQLALAEKALKEAANHAGKDQHHA